jgi:hypothetical protein
MSVRKIPPLSPMRSSAKEAKSDVPPLPKGAEIPSPEVSINRLDVSIDAGWTSAFHYHKSFRLKSEALGLCSRRKHYHMVATQALNQDPPNYSIGLASLKKAHSICVDLFGPMHFNCLKDAITIATIYTELEDAKEAAKMLNVCFNIQGSRLAHPHAIVGIKLCIRMGNLYLSNGYIAEAQKCFIQSAHIADTRFGKWDPKTADTYHDISGCFVKLGDPEMALNFEGKSLLINTAHYGIYHDMTCQTQVNVAVLYRLLKQYERCLEEFYSARKAYEVMYGRHSLEVATVSLCIGFTHHTMNHVLLAEKLYKDSFKIRLDILGEDHEQTNEARELLDEVCSRIGSYAGIKNSSQTDAGMPGSTGRGTTRSGGPPGETRYNANDLMKAIGEVGDRTYVPLPLRRRILEMCEKNSYLTAVDVKSLAMEGNMLETAVCNYISSELQRSEQDTIGNLLHSIGGESALAGGGYGISAGSGGGQGASGQANCEVTIYYPTIMNAINTINKGAAESGVPQPVSPEMTSKVEGIVGHYGGSITMSQLEKELSSSHLAYHRIGVSKLVQELKAGVPTSIQNMSISGGLGGGYGIGGAGGGELTYSADVLEKHIQGVNYLKDDPVIDSSTANKIMHLTSTHGGQISMNDLVQGLGDLNNSGVSQLVRVAQSAAQTHMAKREMAEAKSARRGTVLATRPNSRSRTASGAPNRGRSGTGAFGGGGSGFPSQIAKDDSGGGNVRKKVVNLSGEELWGLFSMKLLSVGLLNKTLTGVRSKRFANKLLSLSVPVYMLRTKKERHLTQKITKFMFPVGVFSYLANAPERRKTQKAAKPVGLAGFSRNSAKPKKKFNSKFKQVNFGANDKVKNTEGTLWGASGLRRESFANFVSGDLESMFAKNTAAPKRVTKKEKKNKANILPQKENQNISMAVFKISKALSYEDLVENVKFLNAAGIGGDILEILKKLIQPINSFKANVLAWRPEGKSKTYELTPTDMKMMTPAEQLIWHLAPVPQLPLRINCMHFVATYKEIVGPLKQNSEVLAGASQAVLNSARLPKVMEYILILANFLNKGGQHENLSGIKLSGLSRVTMTKSNKGINLLQFLVTKLDTKDPDLLLLKDDFVSIKDATLLSNSTMNTERKQLTAGIKQLKQAIESGNKRNDSVWEDELGAVVEKADMVIERLEDSLAEADKVFKDACKYLAEHPAPTYENFFGMLRDFVDLFTLTSKKCKEKAEKEAAAKKRADLAEKKKEERRKRKELANLAQKETKSLARRSKSAELAADAGSTSEALMASMALRRRNIRESILPEQTSLKRTGSGRNVLRPREPAPIIEEGESSESESDSDSDDSIPPPPSPTIAGDTPNNATGVPPPPQTFPPPLPPPQDFRQSFVHHSALPVTYEDSEEDEESEDEVVPNSNAESAFARERRRSYNADVAAKAGML